MNKIWALLVISLLFYPFAGCTSDDEVEIVVFPTFSAVADNEVVYNNTRMDGNPFIVIFSAEWCNKCYTSMHTIWEAQSELPVLVMSTDPAENASGMTLVEWHDSADAYDDNDDGGAGVSLTTYAFMKGVEVGEELGIYAPGTVVFVNSDGEITKTHVGVMDDSTEIQKCWDEASGTA